MGKKKNAPAGAAAGTSSSKAIGILKTLNSDLVNKVAEFRKQIEQLRSQPDLLTADRDIADHIERDVSSTLGFAEINTCNGFYCDSFTPNKSTSPKLWTENWTGWFKAWDRPDPHRLAEDSAYSVARFFQSSGTLQNYYMYHGGTNFGRTTGGPYITTTYDYYAPIDECGNIRQPKWGNLKNLHAVIKKMEKAPTYGNAKATELGNGLSVTKFFGIGIVPGCFLANKNTTDDATLDFEGNKYFLPAWSVSILPDCKQEVYNTAKVNAQTSIMVKKPNQAEAEPTSLIWSWKPEDLSKDVQGLEPDFTTNTLRDQILASVDASDYLWYITSVNVSQDEQMSLQVATTGHILHAFVNGDLIGSEYAPNGKFSFVFEKDVVLNQEMNIIALLSATVGLKNYGPYYELMPAGIVGNYNDAIDLSLSRGSYKVGLDGEKQQVYLDNSNSSWNTGGMFPMKVLVTWYKTTFQAPLGSDPVTVDLLGMGKGIAWVNGQSLGRFWPSYLTWVGGCSPCDYRGPFQSNGCQTGCSEPAQRWYHVPRSFLKAVEPNTLVLFEEAGIDLRQVNFQTVTVGTVCANVIEGKILTWSCPGPQKISALQVASFEDPQSTCGSFQIGSSNVDSAFGLVRQACVGTGDMFGSY